MVYKDIMRLPSDNILLLLKLKNGDRFNRLFVVGNKRVQPASNARCWLEFDAGRWMA